MSVTTNAEKNADAALEHVRAAIRSLEAITIDRCEGCEEWDEHNRACVKNALKDLIDVYESLSWARL